MATPGRLLDFAERGFVTFGSLQFLILDEADRMLDQGFMPDIRRAMSIPSMPSKKSRQTLMFSATFPSEVQRCAGEFLNNYLHLQVKICKDFFPCRFRVILPTIIFSIRLGLSVAHVQMWCRLSTELPSTRRKRSSSASSTRTAATPRRGHWCLLRPRGRRISSALISARR